MKHSVIRGDGYDTPRIPLSLHPGYESGKAYRSLSARNEVTRHFLQVADTDHAGGLAQAA